MEELKSAISQIVGEATTMQMPRFEEVEQQLPPAVLRPLFKRLPRVVQKSLIWRRDAMGKPLLPRNLEAERIVGRFVQQELRSLPGIRKVKATFAPRFHNMDAGTDIGDVFAECQTSMVFVPCVFKSMFWGFLCRYLKGHGRCPRVLQTCWANSLQEITTSSPLPSSFDCAFGYMLGHTAAILVGEQRNFYVACAAQMHLPPKDWKPCAIPFSYLYPDVPPTQPGSCPARQIPKTAKFVKPHLREVFRYFKEAWVEANAFKSPGPIQFDTSGDVGPMSDRPYTLLADYLSVEELIKIIQPVPQPPPLVMSTDPLVVRDVRVRENLGTLEQQRLRYKPAIPNYLRGPATWSQSQRGVIFFRVARLRIRGGYRMDTIMPHNYLSDSFGKSPY